MSGLQNVRKGRLRSVVKMAHSSTIDAIVEMDSGEVLELTFDDFEHMGSLVELRSLKHPRVGSEVLVGTRKILTRHGHTEKIRWRFAPNSPRTATCAID